MTTGRMEAFSDGVIAILITVMVLELPIPHGTTWAALRPAAPVLLTYLMSFAYLGIYWNNHHHMLQATTRVSGLILWANLHLLFWLSLVPFTTAWLGENHFAATPAACYGIVLLIAALAYYGLQRTIIRDQGSRSVVATAVGTDLKGKLSPLLYAAGIGLSFVNRWPAVAIYAGVALMWLIPDRRLERTITGQTSISQDPAGELPRTGMRAGSAQRVAHRVTQPVTTSMPGARQRNRKMPSGMGEMEKKPTSSAGTVLSAPVRFWISIVAACTGIIWPSSESAVTSSSIVRRGELKVSSRMPAVSERVAMATGSAVLVES